MARQVRHTAWWLRVSGTNAAASGAFLPLTRLSLQTAERQRHMVQKETHKTHSEKSRGQTDRQVEVKTYRNRERDRL